jgi:hypothetical protein
MLLDMLVTRLGSTQAGSSSGGSSGSSTPGGIQQQQQQQPPAQFQMPRGSGPFGLLMPADVQGVLSSLQTALAATGPQLQELLQQPGAADLASEVSRQLAQRFAARVVKFSFGASGGPPPMAAVPAGGGSSS